MKNKNFEVHVTLHYHLTIKAKDRDEAERKAENTDLSKQEVYDCDIIVENEGD